MSTTEMSVRELRAEMAHLQSYPYRTPKQRRRPRELREELARASSH